MRTTAESRFATAIPDPDAFGSQLRDWLQSEQGIQSGVKHDSLEESVEHGAALLARLYEGGWNRVGWPPEVGGLGGDVRHRAVMYEQLTLADIAPPEQNTIVEVVGPALTHFSPELAARYLPRALRGEDVWCQGFSEPNSGSDLASLHCRAKPIAGGDLVVDGQKIWTSFGHIADHILLLCRTGTKESRSRGLTMLFLDMSSPGVQTRPITFANGRNEVAEVFFDSVRVPYDHVVGPFDGGWSVASYLLQFERGMYAQIRQAVLASRLRWLMSHLASCGPVDEVMRERIGAARLAVAALHARSSRTVNLLAQDAQVGPAASVDKLLLAAAEQAVFDAGRDVLSPGFELDGAQLDVVQWRTEWFYSRAASVYGGAAEIQRSIIADRILDLPRE